MVPLLVHLLSIGQVQVYNGLALVYPLTGQAATGIAAGSPMGNKCVTVHLAGEVEIG